MQIIGCDFHPSYQQMAKLDKETGELWEGRLEHEQGEARRFYQALQGQAVRVGMEAASGRSHAGQLESFRGRRLRPSV